MNRKGLVVVSFSTLISLGLAGCNANNEAKIQGRYSDSMEPVGYYSNENVHHGGNAIVDQDNDGALIEIMDHTLGGEGEAVNEKRQRILNARDGNGNPGNPTKPLADKDRNFFERDNRFSRADINYHGHLNSNQNVGRTSYYSNYDGELVERIRDNAEAVPNVDSAQAVIYGKNVLVAADLKDETRKNSTAQAIKSKVNSVINGKKITVVTDQATYSRVRSIDNDLRDGGPTDHIQDDLKNLFRSF
ncbi:YhcN/YlaJ family sporulation lipoprotein [Cytobacillus sp. Hz8]|uniref:YhcN/YlaJ family sporulation lipoprotein n=1 Tax=Cytobacillus sp. Hz8 TaxID=3347168 RepID=UPI0035E27A0A